MKRFLCIVLILSVLFSGCALSSNRLKEPVTFYYPRAHDHQENYDDFFAGGTIGSEVWEASGHRSDLNYLLSMYLQGPLDSGLQRPFPSECRVVGITLEDRTLTVKLNAMAAKLDEIALSVACACLATTCLELTDAETVTIQAIGLDQQPLFSRSYTDSSLLLEDTATQPAEATQETQ